MSILFIHGEEFGDQARRHGAAPWVDTGEALVGAGVALCEATTFTGEALFAALTDPGVAVRAALATSDSATDVAEQVEDKSGVVELIRDHGELAGTADELDCSDDDTDREDVLLSGATAAPVLRSTIAERKDNKLINTTIYLIVNIKALIDYHHILAILLYLLNF